jgi:hypothetical protein
MGSLAATPDAPGSPGSAGRTRLGLLLPTFERDSERAVRTAMEAERIGFDGVFCFDHMWPIGEPDKPSVPFEVALGRVAAATSRVRIGTLVARVGFRTPAQLFAAFHTLAVLAGPGRVIAGLGIGDRLSEPEHRAFGVPVLPRSERIAQAVLLGMALSRLGMEVWFGGKAFAPIVAGGELSIPGLKLNLWSPSQEDAGAVPSDRLTIAAPFNKFASMGRPWAAGRPSWAVVGWPPTPAEGYELLVGLFG